jgi:hypothetical protein
MNDDLKTYTGGCRCGQVRYQVELALQASSAKSDRSSRGESSYWGALVKPAAFKLLAGEDSLCDYTLNSRGVHHLVCKHCGSRTFCRGDIPEIGGPYVTVNLKCLDAAKCPDGLLDCV